MFIAFLIAKIGRKCFEMVWKMSGDCPENVRKIFGNVRNMFGNCSENVQKLFGTCLENV